MRIILFNETYLEVDAFFESALIVQPQEPHLTFSAPQMFATSLAVCTFSVLHSYAHHHGFDAGLVRIRERWSYLSEDGRIDAIDEEIHWPGLPASRHDAVTRAAAACMLHRTLEHPPRFSTRVIE